MKKILSVFTALTLALCMAISVSAVAKDDGTTQSVPEGMMAIMAAPDQTGSAATTSTDSSLAAATGEAATDTNSVVTDAVLYDAATDQASESKPVIWPYIAGSAAVIVVLGGLVAIRVFKKAK